MAIQAQFPSCGSQDWMDNGCGGFNQLYSNVHQQKQQQQHCNLLQLQNQLQWNINLCSDNNLVPSTLKSSTNVGNPQSMAFSACDEKHRHEIDHFIRFQGERLRFLLQEQRKQQIALLMKRLESNAVPLLRQKDEEIAEGAKRTMELEDFLKRLEMENQAWRRLAQEKEAMVISLNNAIEQLKDKASCCNGAAEDAESCCEGGGEENTEFDNPDRVWKRGGQSCDSMVCKGCNFRNSCVLFLPCRHLCACKACEAFLEACPVCQTAKKASIEALMG